MHRSESKFGYAAMAMASMLLGACSSNDTSTPGASAPSQAVDAGGPSTTRAPDSGAQDSGAQDSGASGATTTIAQARGGNVTTPITVVGIVTAVRGDDPADTKEWYIEDPSGGSNSGISVYRNHTAKTNPCPSGVTPPAVGDKVQLSGTISPYKGKIEIQPTAQTTLASAQPLPAAQPITPADLAAGGTSTWRGVRVKLAAKLTVDDVTPAKLYDAKCATADAGAPADGGADAGAALCSGCAPPTYAGFQANDGAGHELFVETYFFASQNLQSSPECLSQMGAKPVTVGTTFSTMTGIVDFDPTGGIQYIAPVTDDDYATP